MISDGTKAFLKFGVALLLVLWGFQQYGAYISKRDEALRRSALSPEQRSSEDAAVTAKMERERQLQVAAERERPLKSACRSAVVAALVDPDLASIRQTAGWFDASGVYTGAFEGRAKNGFGAYVPAGWHCKAVSNGANVSIIGVNQYKP